MQAMMSIADTRTNNNTASVLTLRKRVAIKYEKGGSFRYNVNRQVSKTSPECRRPLITTTCTISEAPKPAPGLDTTRQVSGKQSAQSIEESQESQGARDILSFTSGHHDISKSVERQVICFAVGCMSAATEEIELPLSDHKTVALHVCGRCLSLFLDLGCTPDHASGRKGEVSEHSFHTPVKPADSSRDKEYARDESAYGHNRG